MKCLTKRLRPPLVDLLIAFILYQIAEISHPGEVFSLLSGLIMRRAEVGGPKIRFWKLVEVVLAAFAANAKNAAAADSGGVLPAAAAGSRCARRRASACSTERCRGYRAAWLLPAYRVSRWQIAAGPLRAAACCLQAEYRGAQRARCYV